VMADSQRLILTMRDDLKAELLAYFQAHPEALVKHEADAK